MFLFACVIYLFNSINIQKHKITRPNNAAINPTASNGFDEVSYGGKDGGDAESGRCGGSRECDESGECGESGGCGESGEGACCGLGYIACAECWQTKHTQMNM